MASVTVGLESAPPRSESTSASTRVLEAATRNIPKLKEQNYAQWKSAITHSIKAAKLWGYIDGSVEEPSEENTNELIKYMSEASAVRSVILGSLEPGAQRHIEDALAPREAWLTLEKQYLTPGNDHHLIATEKQLVDLRLDEDGDVVDHLVAFCRLRQRLHGTPFELDEQTSIEMLYRSLPPTYRQLISTPERTETKDFSALCARLRDHDLKKIPNTQDQVADTSSPPNDYTCWGVPEDIKAFGLTGDKNPLLEERAAMTCRDCLLKDHKAGTPDCPQYEWRRELWGTASTNAPGTGDSAQASPSERPMAINTKRLSYEFSEPVKVVLDFDEIGLGQNLQKGLRSNYPRPSAIQQCAIIPIIRGRNVLAQAPRGNGKTTALAISTLQVIDSLPHVQALAFTSTNKATSTFQEAIRKLDSTARCYSYDPLHVRQTEFGTLAGINQHQIVAGTPDYLLELIRRNALKTRELKLLVIDDVDQLIEAGFEEQMLEVYRHIPPLAQIVASCTVLSPSVINTTAKFLVDPLRISVNRDEGISMSAQHFFAKVATELKLTVFRALISRLGSSRVVVLCRDVNQISILDDNRKYYIYRLEETTGSSDRGERIRRFKQNSWATLVTTEATFPIADLSNLSIILIIYDIPSNTEGYSELITRWRETHTGREHSIITFVTSDTDEIRVIYDLERHHGAEMIELLWDGEALH